MRMTKLSIENLKIADRAEILEGEFIHVRVWRGEKSSFLTSAVSPSFESVEKAMRTIRRYRKDIPVTSI